MGIFPVVCLNYLMKLISEILNATLSIIVACFEKYFSRLVHLSYVLVRLLASPANSHQLDFPLGHSAGFAPGVEVESQHLEGVFQGDLQLELPHLLCLGSTPFAFAARSTGSS